MPFLPQNDETPGGGEATHTDPVITRLLPVINNEQLKTVPLYDDLNTLFQAYLRQARRMKSIVRISDNYQCQLQELNSRIKRMVEEEERSRIYRDLHDSAGQSLYAVCLHLKMMAQGTDGYEDPKQMAAKLAQEVADVAMELREIAHQLRPSYLREIQLNTAIVNRCEMLRRRGVPVDVTCCGDFDSLPHEVSDNLYRIFQEAVANAAYHAEAGRIVVTLTAENGQLRLMIADDGRGMPEDSAETTGLGLRIMRERSDLINAAFLISTSPAGTTITVSRELT